MITLPGSRETAEAADCGVQFGKPQIDLDRLRSWKDGVVEKFPDYFNPFEAILEAT